MFGVLLFALLSAGVASAALPSSSSPMVIQRIGHDVGETSSPMVFPDIDGPSSTPLAQPSTTWGPIDKTKAPYSSPVAGYSAARTGNIAYWVAGKQSQAYSRGQNAGLYTTAPWPNYLTKMQSEYSTLVTIAVPSAASGNESALITGYGAVLGPSMIVKKGTTTLSIGIDYQVVAKDEGNFTIRALSGGQIAAGATVTVRSQFIMSGSAGTLKINTPLTNYYSASFSFYYAMPTIGSGEQFYALQLYAGDDTIEHDEQYVNTLSPSWIKTTYDLTKRTDGLSRSSSAYVAMRFVDVETGQEPVLVGAGPRIDDLVLSGFKYGPVRSLTADTQGLNIVLTWDKPYESYGSTTVDGRSVAYRIWRAESGTDSFTELTTSANRITSTTFADSTAAEGHQYVYLVQAWDTGTGAGYGEMAPRSNAATGMAASVSLSAAALTGDTNVDLTVAPGATVRLSIEAIVNSSPAVGNMLEVQTRAGSEDEWELANSTALATDETGKATFDVAPQWDGERQYRVRMMDDRDYLIGVSDPVTVACNAQLLATAIRNATTNEKTTTPYYKDGIKLNAVIGNTQGEKALEDVPVILQYRPFNSSTWTNVDLVTSADGVASLTVYPTFATYYQFLLPKPGGGIEELSDSTLVKPTVYLTTPTKSRTYPTTTTTTTFQGKIAPKHSSGSVTLYFQQKIKSGSSYVWKTRKKAVASLQISSKTGSSYWRYKYRPPYKGTWRVRAKHGDKAHATSYSSYLNMTVK